MQPSCELADAIRDMESSLQQHQFQLAALNQMPLSEDVDRVRQSLEETIAFISATLRESRRIQVTQTENTRQRGSPIDSEASESDMTMRDSRNPQVVDMISIDDPDDDVVVVDAPRKFGYLYPESLDLIPSNSASSEIGDRCHPIYIDDTSSDSDESNSDFDSVSDSSDSESAASAPVPAATNVAVSSDFAAWENSGSSFGSRYLQKFGFCKGQGLGVHGQGVAEPVMINQTVLKHQVGLDFYSEACKQAASSAKRRQAKAERQQREKQSPKPKGLNIAQLIFKRDWAGF